MKEQFFKYLEAEDDLNLKSYNFVLYKYIFEMMDNDGYVPAYELTVAFKNYYKARIENGKVPDLNADDCIKNAVNSSAREIYTFINQNPYNEINEQGYLSKETRANVKESDSNKEYFKLTQVLAAELTPDDIDKIRNIIEKKLTIYYKKVDSVSTVNLQGLLNYVMNGYLDAKKQPFSGNSMANTIRNNFPSEIFKTGLVTPEKYVITGGPGQGNWVSIPWVGIFNRSITTSATKGVYIVYLFSGDCESVYLTFNQGCTELKNKLGKSKAIEFMHNVTDNLVKAINSRSFSIGDHIDLKDNHELPYLYERGTIFYREYKKGNLPSNEILVSDLKKMVEIYDEYVHIMQENNYDSKSETKVGGVIETTNNKITIKEIIEQIKTFIKVKGFTYDEHFIENFYLCLKSKPFVILAGISGTGKTKLVKLFAEAIGAEYLLVPVRPDWSDSSDLFGHLDLSGNFIEGAIIRFIKNASLNPNKPYILCLDEMNLARVEYYFSDFLSIIETRYFENSTIISEPLINAYMYGNSNALKDFGEIKFNENLYVIGTVNMDETTFPFSRKVLDRANTIEFSYVDLIPKDFSDEEPRASLSIENDFLKTEYLQLQQCNDKEYITNICIKLKKINEILKNADAHVGYRVRDEVAFYMFNNKKTALLSEDEGFDNEIMQKILPRIQGSSSAIKNMLIELFQECAGDYTGISKSNIYEQMTNYIKDNQCKYKKSASKIAFMIRRFEEDGFTSYWI